MMDEDAYDLLTRVIGKQIQDEKLKKGKTPFYVIIFVCIALFIAFLILIFMCPLVWLNYTVLGLSLAPLIVCVIVYYYYNRKWENADIYIVGKNEINRIQDLMLEDKEIDFNKLNSRDKLIYLMNGLDYAELTSQQEKEEEIVVKYHGRKLKRKKVTTVYFFTLIYKDGVKEEYSTTDDFLYRHLLECTPDEDE